MKLRTLLAALLLVLVLDTPAVPLPPQKASPAPVSKPAAAAIPPPLAPGTVIGILTYPAMTNFWIQYSSNLQTWSDMAAGSFGLDSNGFWISTVPPPPAFFRLRGTKM